MKSASTGRSAPAGRAPAAAPNSRRKFVVLVSLVGMMTLTSALLLALAPAPLTPGAASSLFAVDAPQSLDVIFNTHRPLRGGHWNAIYVHHSRTPSGNAMTLGASAGGVADHFVIGNGDGCADGELQIAQRWNQQQPAAPTAGLASIDPRCVSICLVGDFTRNRPTPTQMRRLTQLVDTLRGELAIPADRVVLDHQNASPAGLGFQFPVREFLAQLAAD